jgi:hypothetical protein
VQGRGKVSCPRFCQLADPFQIFGGLGRRLGEDDLFGGATALLPMYAKEILGCGPIGLGALRAAPFVGAFLVAVWLAARPGFRNTGRVLFGSVAVFGVCMIVFGLSTSLWLSLIALAVSGAVDNVSVVIRHVLVQMKTPDELRGRTTAVNSVVATGVPVRALTLDRPRGSRPSRPKTKRRLRLKLLNFKNASAAMLKTDWLVRKHVHRAHANTHPRTHARACLRAHTRTCSQGKC